MSVTVTIADRRPERRDANGIEHVALPCSGRALMSVICLYVNALQADSQFSVISHTIEETAPASLYLSSHYF